MRNNKVFAHTFTQKLLLLNLQYTEYRLVMENTNE